MKNKPRKYKAVLILDVCSSGKEIDEMYDNEISSKYELLKMHTKYLHEQLKVIHDYTSLNIKLKSFVEVK